MKQGGDATNHSVGAHISTHLRSTIQQPVFSNFGGVIELTYAPVVPAPISASMEKKASGVCPYKGLEYFDFRGTDPDHFFGRGALTDQLLDAVRQGNFLAVLGPSGSGKSSVVRAGLIHQLKTGHRLSGSRAWPVLAFKPISKERIEGGGEFSDDPLDNLAWAFVDLEASDLERADQLNSAKKLVRQGAEGLADLVRVKAGDRRVVMLVDQFEEVFTLCENMDKRRAFLKCILGGLPVLGKLICLIITMLADFLGKCAEGEYAGLPDLIQNHLITVTPMNEDEIRRAIANPAEAAGLEVQYELAAQMIADVKSPRWDAGDPTRRP